MNTKSPRSGARRMLVTMALPYANGDIHLGHMVEAVQADVYVRYQRLRGNEAVFICADDTHGTPIELNALARGIPPRQLVAEVWQRHVADYAAFDIDFNLFYSTDSAENRRYAEMIFESLRSNGLVVEREVEQYYCEHDARFLPDRFIVGACPRCGAADQYGDVCEACGATYEPVELAGPRCRLCNTPPVMRASTHLFVQLDSSAPFLRDYLNDGIVLQADMRGFVNNWIDEGLRQWCISRDGPYFGFEIPGYPGKFFYVWLDAPIGYLSSSARWCADHGRAVEEFWDPNGEGEVVHIIGKDIVYFHTLFWPVMLRSGGFKLPTRFFVHGFLTVEGGKMSKSRGTFIMARSFIERVTHPQAAQYLRFFYAARLSGTTGDLDLNGDEFCARVNTTLANNIGNLHHRTFVFAARYLDAQLPDVDWDEEIARAVHEAIGDIERAYENTNYKEVVQRVHALGSLGNKYYQDSAPWELMKKGDRQGAARVIVTCASLVRSLLVFLKPVVPHITAAFEQSLGVELTWADARFGLRGVAAGAPVKLAQPIEPAQFAQLYGRSADADGNAADEGLISIEEFGRVQLQVATVVEAECVAKSKKLLKLQVEAGGVKRQVVAGIAEYYTPEQMRGKQVVLVANLKPATLMGELSQGMLLAAKDGKRLVLLGPEEAVRSGAKVS